MFNIHNFYDYLFELRALQFHRKMSTDVSLAGRLALINCQYANIPLNQCSQATAIHWLKSVDDRTYVVDKLNMQQVLILYYIIALTAFQENKGVYMFCPLTYILEVIYIEYVYTIHIKCIYNDIF